MNRFHAISNSGKTTDTFGSKEDGVWTFVSPPDYEIPGLPAHSAMANAWATFKQIFRRVDESSQTLVKQESELRSLSHVRLEHLVPFLDLRVVSEALNASVVDWLAADDSDRSVKWIIGQPYADHAQTVRLWGERHQAITIASPSCEQILAGKVSWLDDWPKNGQLWVLPNLEHCFLRHPDGLKFVRLLFERIDSGRFGRGMIGCDSWAWSFLQRIWPVSQTDVLTLQAFDGLRLVQLLSGMTASRSDKRIRFRSAANGEDILAVPSDADQVHSEITRLAAHCRGNVGIALHYWRRCLRSEAETDTRKPNDQEETEQKNELSEESVWVASVLPEPVLPVGMEEDSTLLLHVLLIHGGLPGSVLSELLPLSHPLCMTLLQRLQRIGFVQYRNDRWSIHELAYSFVRNLLHGRAYLVDDF